MCHRFQRASVAPDGFAVDAMEVDGTRVQIQLRSRQLFGHCPDCGRQSRRVQSRYLRRPSDLPLGGRRVELTIVVRRFWCDAVLCGRRIFSEQFGKGVLARYGRRPERLGTIVHHLGLALGGRPAAAFALRLMMPVSNDTLLRVVRRRITRRNDELSVIGIDGFAFRRGRTYGTIVCDLERRRPVTLLPDRALDTSRARLSERPSISIVARDRGGGYGEAIAKALPHADQVADRWHLMENSSRSRAAAKLDGWLVAAKQSLVGSFASGVEKDIAAVRNAIISPSSNGQTEGQITRLKLIERQMYGQAKLDLLLARSIGAT